MVAVHHVAMLNGWYSKHGEPYCGTAGAKVRMADIYAHKAYNEECRAA